MNSNCLVILDFLVIILNLDNNGIMILCMYYMFIFNKNFDMVFLIFVVIFFDFKIYKIN